MQPTKFQEFVARHSPVKLWCLLVSLAAAIFMIRAGGFSFPMLHQWQNVLILLALIPGSLGIGFIFGGFGYVLLFINLFDLEAALARRNGGPFIVGDSVQILSGPHRGRVGTVYTVDQGQGGPRDVYLRVQLGEKEKRTCKDLFEPWRVVRAG